MLIAQRIEVTENTGRITIYNTAIRVWDRDYNDYTHYENPTCREIFEIDQFVAEHEWIAEFNGRSTTYIEPD